MNRRDILKCLAAAPWVTVSGQLFAAPSGSARLLVIFLRGGYDAANLLVPVSSPFYYEARPNIAIARPDSAPNTALALDADWGLHPALRDSIYPLYQKRQAAFVAFAGTDNLSRSHFETQDAIEMGQSADGSRRFDSGFLNRLVTELNGATPMAFTEQLPLIFRGSADVPNIAMKSLGNSAIDARQQAIIASMYSGSALAAPVQEGFDVRKQVMQQMGDEMVKSSRNAITAKGFALDARRIAKLMAERFNVGFVDIGGWDTHVGEGGDSGYLAGRLDELGRGLAAFADEMGNAWANTVVTVISEFGRTFRENGNRGTDHGHGSVYWILGGGIQGGQIAGRQMQITPASLFQNRDYPVLNEYRSLFAGLFRDMYGLNVSQVGRIFPEVKPASMGLI